MKKYHFVKQTEKIEEIIEARKAVKRWNPDPKGYFLIRVNHKEKKIEVAYANNQHVIRKVIFGSDAEEIYNTIIKLKLITLLEHAAYLGKELYKAELALQHGRDYRQEFPLKF